MKNKKTTKKFAIALLALLGVVSTGATYAYWQGAVLGANQNAAAMVTPVRSKPLSMSAT